MSFFQFGKEGIGSQVANRFIMSIGELAANEVKKRAIAAIKQMTKNEDIIHLTDQFIGSVPQLISSALSVEDSSNPNYTIITEDNNNPFPIDDKMRSIAKHITRKETTEIGKSKKIFDWIIENISYGENRNDVGYRNAKEVLTSKEGVCGEQAILFITLCRAVGLKGRYVSVDVDCYGCDVSHACAAIYLNDKVKLIDLTYGVFGCDHQRYEILRDEEAVSKFKLYRKNK